MTVILFQENREDRYGKTERKNLRLTNEAVKAVPAYAERHRLYFSVAIESLALMGLGQAAAESLARLVGNWLERLCNRPFKRFAKLLLYAAMPAEEANEKANCLILPLFRREASRDPDNFLSNMYLSTDPHSQPEAQVRPATAGLSGGIHEAAVAHLQKPLGDIIEFLTVEVADEPENA